MGPIAPPRRSKLSCTTVNSRVYLQAVSVPDCAVSNIQFWGCFQPPGVPGSQAPWGAKDFALVLPELVRVQP